MCKAGDARNADTAPTAVWWDRANTSAYEATASPDPRAMSGVMLHTSTLHAY